MILPSAGTHARINRDGERFTIEDLGSSNGTYLTVAVSPASSNSPKTILSRSAPYSSHSAR